MRKNQVAFFQKYLQIAPFSHAIWRSAEASKLSDYNLIKPIIDVGCGFGEFAGVFFSSQVEVGVDINSKDILKAAQTGKFRKTMVADARNLPFNDKTFNTALSISTLEHIPNNYKVFKEVYRILKPGGKFYFTVPTNEFYNNLLFVRFFKSLGLTRLALFYYRFINKAFKHVYIVDEKKWLQRAQKTGFIIETTQGTISKLILNLWELGLPIALPYQLSRILFGERFIVTPKLKAKLLIPFIKYLKPNPFFKANILIIAKKPVKNENKD